MSVLTNEEQLLVQDALSIYIRVITQQYPPQTVDDIARSAQAILTKLAAPTPAEDGSPIIPRGISEEWYDAVCANCPKCTREGCSDKITEKFPGKCDPILKYEFAKAKQLS